ncbi:hypothetical protein CMK10_16550 [Candidatus Poribacteria bacterium]|nr:hypothetical protein [Candidatus Poribacteria bacterium]
MKFADERKNQDSFRYINFTKHNQNANQSVQKSFEDDIVFDSLKKNVLQKSSPTLASLKFMKQANWPLL